MVLCLFVGCTHAGTQDGYVSFSNLAVLISGSNWHFIFTVISPPGNFNTVCFYYLFLSFFLKYSPFSFIMGLAPLMNKSHCGLEKKFPCLYHYGVRSQNTCKKLSLKSKYCFLVSKNPNVHSLLVVKIYFECSTFFPMTFDGIWLNIKIFNL